MPIPDSGLYAAMGYSRESGLPLEFGPAGEPPDVGIEKHEDD